MEMKMRGKMETRKSTDWSKDMLKRGGTNIDGNRGPADCPRAGAHVDLEGDKQRASGIINVLIHEHVVAGGEAPNDVDEHQPGDPGLHPPDRAELGPPGHEGVHDEGIGQPGGPLGMVKAVQRSSDVPMYAPGLLL